VFRRIVVKAYDARCAITGLKLINGGGRAEVEAAHIRPVEKNGPDTVQNGLALSGTVHWMFDRGLISLSDELDILVSRQVNDPDSVWSLVNKTRVRWRRPARWIGRIRILRQAQDRLSRLAARALFQAVGGASRSLRQAQDRLRPKRTGEEGGSVDQVRTFPGCSQPCLGDMAT
jgi:hypothetical protein